MDQAYLDFINKYQENKNYIFLIENFVPEEHFNLLKSYLDSNKNNFKYVGKRNSEENWSAIVFNEGDDSVTHQILRNIKNTGLHESQKIYSEQLDLSSNSIMITKWNIGESMGPHKDNQNYHIVNMFYINDNYLGGEIFFPNLNIKIKPKANSMIIFPGHFLHQVEKIESGERYTFANWLQLTNSNYYDPVAEDFKNI